MVTVLTETGEIEVFGVYMRKVPTAPAFTELGHPKETYVLFDAGEGYRIISAYERSSLYFWITTNDIHLHTLH